jgi:hypothetical protein
MSALAMTAARQNQLGNQSLDCYGRRIRRVRNRDQRWLMSLMKPITVSGPKRTFLLFYPNDP